MMKYIAFILAACPALAMAAHPLVSDDTSTQGAGKWQYEINTDQGAYQPDDIETHVGQFNTTLTRGVTDSVDLAVNLPYARTTVAGNPTVSGVGDTSLILKWRFYDKDGVSVAIKPQINIATGDTDKGFGNGRTSAGVNGLLTVASGKATFLANLGVTSNNNNIGARKALWNASAAVLFSATKMIKVAFDTGVYHNPDVSSRVDPAFALVGIIWSPNESIDLDIGYKAGLNSAEVKHSVGAGLTVHF